MGEARFARLRRIVSDAMDLAPEHREAFVRAAGNGEPELIREALELLGFEDAGNAFTRHVEVRIAELATGAAGGRARPSTIGPFEILEEIGEGGMGRVYRARQREPLEREVALKVILRGWNNEQVLARFGAERRTVARMEHPNIARVFDAGTTDDGQPWFAMELVRGESFHRACDTRCLSVRERLRLFLSVCRAVHHAHQRGVIHRDLKPSNILVAEHEGELVPKVIDFGIAKALTPSVDDLAHATIEGQVIGTPAYMSPERLAGSDEDVDIRADVYSLGVLLYELLCGELPFEPSTGRVPGTMTAPTPRPSTRLTRTVSDPAEIARRRAVSPSALRRMLRGELDWIALKAMAPLPEHRFASAHELLLDVERHLAGEPVSVGAPSAVYRFGKFARRHRLAIGAVAAVLLTLGAGLLESNRQRLRAESARREAEAITHFLTNMLAAVDPDERGRAVTVAELLDEAVTGVRDRFAEEPGIRARLQLTLGRSLDALGRYEVAASQLEQALATHVRLSGSHSLTTLETKRHLADLYLRQGRHREAEALYREVIEVHSRRSDGRTSEILAAKNRLGELLRREGDFAQAELLHRECLELLLATDGPRARSTLDAMNALANDHAEAGAFDRAAALYEEALTASTETLGPGHSTTLSLINNLALVRWEQGRAAECESLLAVHMDVRSAVSGPDHPITMEAALNLAAVQSARGDLQTAMTQLEALLSSASAALGDSHRVTLTAGNNLAWAYAEAGEFVRAEQLTLRTLESRAALLGQMHPETLITMNNLGQLYEKMGRLDEAEDLLARTLAGRRTVLGDDHPHTRSSVETLQRVRARAAEVE